MKTSTLTFIFFLAFAFGCMIGIAKAQPEGFGSTWTTQDTLRAIENQQALNLQQQAIEAQRQQNAIESIQRSQQNFNQQQSLWEQRRMNQNLERLNRGY